MKKLPILLSGLLISSCFASEKNEEQKTWYNSYKEAALAGTVLALVEVPLKPLGYGLAMSATGEGTFSMVAQKFLPHLGKSIIVSTALGAISGCCVVAAVKARNKFKKKKNII